MPAYVNEWTVERAGVLVTADDGLVYVTTTVSDSVLVFSPDGQLVDIWVMELAGERIYPMYMDYARGTFTVAVALDDTSRIVRYDTERRLIADWTERHDHSFWAGGTDGLAVESTGATYTLEFYAESVVKYSADGTFEREWATLGSEPGFVNWPGGIVIGANRVVYISDTLNHRVLEFSTRGDYLGEFGTHGSGDDGFRWPVGMAFDDDDLLYIADRSNWRIKKVTAAGAYLNQFGREVAGFEPVLIDIHGPHVYVMDENDVIYHFAYAETALAR